MGESALACLETRIALANDENLATTAHDLAIAVTGLGGFERGQDFHDETISYRVGKACILTYCSGERNSESAIFSLSHGIQNDAFVYYVKYTQHIFASIVQHSSR